MTEWHQQVWDAWRAVKWKPFPTCPVCERTEFRGEASKGVDR